MSNINDVKKLTKDFIFNFYFKILVDYDDYYNDELYDKLTRSKMLKSIIDYYNDDISNIYNILNDNELSFLNNIINVSNIDDIKPYHDIYDTFLISTDGKCGYAIMDELNDSISIALSYYNDNMKDIEKNKEVAYLIVGLVRSYGALYYKELKYLVNKYVNCDIDDYLNHPYVLRYVNTKSNVIRLCNLYYEEDYIDILKSHNKEFKTLYEYNTLINIGKYYFDISNDRYKNLLKDNKAFDFVNNDKEEIIIHAGLSIMDRYLDNKYNYLGIFYTEDSIKRIISFMSILPIYELNDNSYNVMDKSFTDCYYSVIPSLYRYASKRLSFNLTINEDNSLNSDEVYELIELLDKNKYLIDEFIKNSKLDINQINLLNGFKKGFNSDFIVYKHLKNGSVFIDANTNKCYLVKGLITPIDRMLRNNPSLVKTYIFPYDNNIITSGIISELPVRIGNNLKKEIKVIYDLNKDDIKEKL